MATVRDRVNQIIAAAPKGWSGTTYPNDARFVGREAFITAMLEKLQGTDEITQDQLANLYPEDYVRLGSPYSTLLEVVVALERGFDPYGTFAFGSTRLPLIAVLMAVSVPVYVYKENESGLITDSQEKRLLNHYGRQFEHCDGAPKDHGADAVVLYVSDSPRDSIPSAVDAVIGTDGLLFVISDKVPRVDSVNEAGQRREGIHTMRKRLGAPPPTPQAVSRLLGDEPAVASDTTDLKQHLKELAGLGDAPGDVLLSTVGLSALASVVMASLELGGGTIDSLMCSTAYGGSSQQTDILSSRSKSDSVHMELHKFNIQGAAAVVFDRICDALNEMRELGAKKPLTLVQLEYPTNPDMKDTDVVALEEVLLDYQDKTGSAVVLLLDTTFSPPSKVAGTLTKGLSVIVFNSLSKSVTGGYTTGGSVVANNTPLAQNILQLAHEHLELMDTGAKPAQLNIFNSMHAQAEERVQQAHDNCVRAAKAFEAAVERHSGHAMKTNFVTDAQIEKGVTPATFSFNLPPPSWATKEQLEAFAQDFVDSLANSPFGLAGGIKPCVSFGQKNSTIYATVPATSTQGVISKELTAKQALGGVQLVRLSFPTDMDHGAWEAAADEALAQVYTKPAGQPDDATDDVLAAPIQDQNSFTPPNGTSIALVAGAAVAAVAAIGAAVYFSRRRANAVA